DDVFPMAGGETMADGGAVVVTDHVVAERDIALPREIGRARRPGVQLLILQSAVSPVPVRTKHGGAVHPPLFMARKRVLATITPGSSRNNPSRPCDRRDRPCRRSWPGSASSPEPATALR